MTLVSICGAVRDDGRDCPNRVDPDAPINLCAVHLDVAYQWVARERGSVSEGMPHPCECCGESIGREYATGWICDRCGWTVGREPTPLDLSGRGLSRSGVEVVYYFRFDTRVKIGTSTNLRARALVLPHDELLAIERGGRTVEQKRHAQFAATRIPGGEWFGRSPELDSHVRVMRAGVEDPWAQYDYWVRRDAT